MVVLFGITLYDAKYEPPKKGTTMEPMGILHQEAL